MFAKKTWGKIGLIDKKVKLRFTFTV
jgi:hypothetical protein